MTTQQERILIEIKTIANTTGIAQAEAGMLGMNVATLALAAVLGGLMVVGKAAIENYKALEEANLSLTQAVTANNAEIGKSATVHADVSKQVKAHNAAVAHLAALQKGTYHPAIQLTQLQLMKLQDAEKRVADTTSKTTAGLAAHARALRSLAELQVSNDAKVRGATTTYASLSAAQAKVRETAAALALASKPVVDETNTQTIAFDHLNLQLETFLQTNKRFIANQYDVEAALAAIVRAGNSEKDSMRILNDALDLAVIKHEDVSAAGKSLTLALAGNGRALKELGISATEYSAIMKNKTLTVEQQHLALLALIETKTKGGRKVTDELAGSQHALNKDWQDFTARIGPGVVGGLNKIVDAADTGVQILDLLDQALVKVGKDNAAWGNVQNAILGGIYGNAKLAPGAIIAGSQSHNSSRPGPHDPGAVAAGRAPVIVNVHSHGKISQAEAAAIASAVRRQLKQYG